MSSRDIPEAQHDRIVLAIYESASSADWELLSPSERTRKYSEWVTDPKIGGILGRYMTPEQTRSWIKDGPMKEFSRALRGAGRYARFGHFGGTTATDIVTAALGAGWLVQDGSLGTKPLHCIAEGPPGRAFVAWGRSSNFRHLIWASLKSAISDIRSLVVVTDTIDRPTTEPDKAFQQQVADRCGIELKYVREKLGVPTQRGGNDAS